MRVRLLLSFFLIALVSASAFAATKAVLSDQVTLAANTFNTGTVDLQISKSTSSNPSTFTDTSIAGFTGKVLPGESTSVLFWLKNDSSDIHFEMAAQSSSLSGSIDPSKVTVTFTAVNNDGTSSGAPSASHTLAEWNASPLAMNSFIFHSVNSGRQRYKMEVALDSDVPAIGGTVVFDVVFTGTQTSVTPTPTPTATPTP